MAQQDRDHVIGHLETEKGLSKKYKEELERMKKEFLEHQRVCEKYAGGYLHHTHAFFIRNDKMASSTRSFLIFTPFLVPKIS